MVQWAIPEEQETSMSEETARATTPRQPTADPRRDPTPAARPATCAPAAEAVPCPACGETMRLWANYHRCRNCGYKESCCF
jgi:hypothetical protein